MSNGEVRITDPDTGGEKGQKPQRYDLLPWYSLEQVTLVYSYGAEKYADDNWRKGYSWRLSVGALFRHITAFLKGESYDPESNIHHLAHAAFHLFALMEFQRTGKGKDDIPERKE
jgi:hypothetical protein